MWTKRPQLFWTGVEGWLQRVSDGKDKYSCEVMLVPNVFLSKCMFFFFFAPQEAGKMSSQCPTKAGTTWARGRPTKSDVM